MKITDDFEFLKNEFLMVWLGELDRVIALAEGGDA